VEPKDLTVIGHTSDLLADIYTVKYGAYLHFTVVLNAGGEGAQFRRNGCSICAVEVRNLARNTHSGELIDSTSVIGIVEEDIWGPTFSIDIEAEKFRNYIK